MKQIMQAAAVLMALALTARGATYVWSGLGGVTNTWSNPDNWTNSVDGSTGVPGAGDDAVFPKAEEAPAQTVAALDANVTVNNVIFGNNFAGMQLTGAYMLTVTTAAPALWGANYFGGSATIGCALNFPNVASDVVWVNYNQEFTINGDVNLLIGNNARQLTINGETAKAAFAGQLRGYTNATAQRVTVFCNPDSGVVELGTQHYPHRMVMCRKGTLVLKGNYDAPNGAVEHTVGFPNWDGNSPRRIWIVAEAGTAVFSNRFAFFPRGAADKYQEFAVKAPTVNAICVGQVRFDDKIWVFVEGGSYLKLAGGINKGDSATTHGVYLDGGGTTDLARAALTTFEIPFIVSNGVLLANNGTNGLATHGPVTACAGGVVGGAGGVGALTTESGARITPGNSIGTLFVSNNCALAAGTIIDWDVQHATADLLHVAGTLDISAGSITVRVHGTCEETDTNVLMRAGTLVGGPANVTLVVNTNDFISGGVVFQEGQQILVTGLVPVPEPAALLALLAGALVGLRKK